MSIFAQIALNGMIDVSDGSEEDEAVDNQQCDATAPKISMTSSSGSCTTPSDSGIMDDCVIKKRF